MNHNSRDYQKDVVKRALARDRDSLKIKSAELRKQGLTDHAISKKLGVSPGTITAWLGKNPNIPDLEPLKPQAAELRKQGFTDKAISQKLGVCPNTITKWLDKRANSPKNPAYPASHTPDTARSLVPPS
jgi:orotate phosphoribosyltransferase-like protein